MIDAMESLRHWKEALEAIVDLRSQIRACDTEEGLGDLRRQFYDLAVRHHAPRDVLIFAGPGESRLLVQADSVGWSALRPEAKQDWARWGVLWRLEMDLLHRTGRLPAMDRAVLAGTK